MTTTVGVPLDELRQMFAGVRVPDDQPVDGGGWATAPSHSMVLACEIARRIDPQTEAQLRAAIYGQTPADLIHPDALEAVRLGFSRYRMLRGGRGL